MGNMSYDNGHMHDWREYQADGPNASAYIPARYKCAKCNFTVDASTYAYLKLLQEITSRQKWIPVVVSILALLISFASFVKDL